VFSNGVYEAVTSAFPKYAYKVHVLRHGTHLCPGVASMSRSQAKVRIHEFLLNESDLDQQGKGRLRQEGVLLEPDATIIGAAGFITASKGSELLFQACDRLRRMMPQREIVAVRVGMLRAVDNKIDSKYAANLRTRCNGEGQCFLETYLPEDALHVLLRALDVYFYWPTDCTQSGVLAHALGAGAVIACRDMEGVGETVRLAGGLACADFEEAIIGLRELILDPKLRNRMSERALRYAEEFSWRSQALQHFELAEQLCRSRVHRLVLPVLPLMTVPGLTEGPAFAVSGDASVAA
jgi:glycosyltransferase involved in cell wall biosynthesis